MENLENMGYFHALKLLKLAFLSSLRREYMFWEGFYHNFSTKKTSDPGFFSPWPYQGTINVMCCSKAKKKKNCYIGVTRPTLKLGPTLHFFFKNQKKKKKDKKITDRS